MQNVSNMIAVRAKVPEQRFPLLFLIQEEKKYELHKRRHYQNGGRRGC